MMPFHPVKPIRGGRPLDAFFQRLRDSPAWVCQAKINGQRTLWSPSSDAPGGGKGVLWSRRGLPIAKVPEIQQAMRSVDVVVDGELLVKDTPIYYLFDLPDHTGTLDERWKALTNVVEMIGHANVKKCPAEITWEDVSLNQWEGVVFKKRSSKYPKSLSSDNTTPSWIKYRAEWL